jgi:hypothetical protein
MIQKQLTSVSATGPVQGTYPTKVQYIHSISLPCRTLPCLTLPCFTLPWVYIYIYIYLMYLCESTAAPAEE